MSGWEVVSPVRADYGGDRHRGGGADSQARQITYSAFYGILLIIMENKNKILQFYRSPEPAIGPSLIILFQYISLYIINEFYFAFAPFIFHLRAKIQLE